MIRSTLTIVIAILISSCGSKKYQKDILTEEEVKTVIEKFDNGWRNKKSDLVDSCLSEQYVYYTQSGRAFDRNGIISTAGSDVYLLEAMERKNLNMQIDGNTAVVNTIWKGKGVYQGEAFDDTQRCSVTIVKHDGVVKILAEHCTPIK